MVARGDWNVAIGVLGGVGSGKSTYALKRARELGRGAYVIAHDPTMSYRGPDVQRHKTAAALAAALATRPGGIHALDVDDAGEVLRVARAVAAESLRAGGGERGVPVLLVLDEAVAASDMSPTYVPPTLKSAFMMRRHLHLGFLWTTQRPANVHPLFVELATEIVMFRLSDERALRRLEENGLPPAELARVRSLPRFVPIVHRP